MPITQAFCNSFKRELLAMTPHRPEDAYKIALYMPAASLNKFTTRYSAANEVPAGGDYVPGGQLLRGLLITADGDTVTLDWTVDPVWQNVTLTAAGALIYNSLRENRTLAVLAFVDEAGRPMPLTARAGSFGVRLPAPGAKFGLIRIT